MHNEGACLLLGQRTMRRLGCHGMLHLHRVESTWAPSLIISRSTQSLAHAALCVFYDCPLTQFNVSPSFTLELIDRLAKVFKDYCGVLTEEAIRKNFILIYELLDEMIVRATASIAIEEIYD